MTIARRQFMSLVASASILPALASVTLAQGYPSRPVRIVAPVPAGGSVDTLARLIGQWLGQRLGHPFIIENRPGAATNIGTEAVARATPDGYTLLAMTANNATNAAIYDKLGFNFIRDIAPVARTVRIPLVLEVHPSFPVKTIPELITYAKANPGKINMASSGNGSPSHVAGELFAMMAGVKFTHVPYRGDAPAITDLLGGQVHVYFGFLPASLEHIRSGKLRALGVTTASRLDVLPDVPAIAESLPGYEATSWHGIGAPAGTPDHVIERLNVEINAGLRDGSISARVESLGAVIDTTTTAEFARFIVEETEKWARVIKFAGIKVSE